MCQSDFSVICEDGTNIFYKRRGRVEERSDKKSKGREWERKPTCFCLPLQGHPFCWIKYFRLIEVGFSLLLFRSIPPSPFPLSPSITRPTAAPHPPPPLVFHLTFLILLPLSLSPPAPRPPFWGAADAVPIATIGSMFVWYACDPLITLLSADNNSKSHTADREMWKETY